MELKKTFQMSQFSIAISRYLEAEINYRYFRYLDIYFFYLFRYFVDWCFKIMHKKFQVNSTKIEGVTAIFVISPVTTIIVYR